MTVLSPLTDSAEVSRAKVTVETPHSSVKMRAANQIPTIGPDDDLTGILAQVGAFFSSFTKTRLKSLNLIVTD